MSDLQDIQKQIDELTAQKNLILAQEKIAVIESIKKQIADFGITAQELGFKATKGSKTSTVPVKYRHNGETWTGRGLKPKWLNEYLAGGGKLEDIEVK